MTDELRTLKSKIQDANRSLSFARAGEDRERVVYLENELSAMLKDLEEATGKPYVVEPFVPFKDPEWWDLVTGA